MTSPRAERYKRTRAVCRIAQRICPCPSSPPAMEPHASAPNRAAIRGAPLLAVGLHPLAFRPRGRSVCRAGDRAGPPHPPPAEPSKYTGPGSCSSTSCHGSVKPRADSRIFQNEYSIWVVQDKHAKAYNALTGAVGERMARNPRHRQVRGIAQVPGVPRARRPRRSSAPRPSI